MALAKKMEGASVKLAALRAAARRGVSDAFAPGFRTRRSHRYAGGCMPLAWPVVAGWCSRNTNGHEGWPLILYHAGRLENAGPNAKVNKACRGSRGKGPVATRISPVRISWLIAIAAVLAFMPHAADAKSHGRRHAAKPPLVTSAGPSRELRNYYVPDVTDAAGNHVPIMKLPGGAVVIPRQVIDDQQAITVCGALRNVSGVSCQ